MVRLGRAVCAAVLLAPLPAAAFVPVVGPRLQADRLTAMPAANLGKPLRSEVRLDYSMRNPSAAWLRFVANWGTAWQASWDQATGVPSRIWGVGIPVPGACGSAAIAEAVARNLLAAHVDLLAPGASAADFELVSNHWDGDQRSVGFVQRAGGLRVVGGQLSFRFKADRLFVIASQALPNVSAPQPLARLAAPELSARATTALRAAVQLPAAPVRSLGDDVVLPLVGDYGVLGYRVASPIELDGGGDGRYRAYADPATGAILAVHQVNLYAAGTVLYHGVDRYPANGYVDRPAPYAHVTINGTATDTSSAGGVTWSPDGTVQLGTAIVGDYVAVTNRDTNWHTANATLSLTPGGSATWDATAQAEDDAQLDAYADVNIVKSWVYANVDPNMPTLLDQMNVYVNEQQTCNAYFDGQALNFYWATPAGMSPQCENTARIQDVGFHEFGHAVHFSELIAGVGSYDGSMGEGAADFLAVSITGDPGMGRGFFYKVAPLRDLTSGAQWPDAIGEIHSEGLIYGGAWWDLRTALFAELGPAQALPLVEKLWLGTLRRATDIPSSLIEALATDDDNGNLADGTPHECEIRAAYGKHGIRTATGSIVAPGTLDQLTLAIGIAVQIDGLSTRCTSDTLGPAVLYWLPPYTGVPTAGHATLTPAGPSSYAGTLPLSPQETVQFKALVGFADQTQMTLADNLGDPYYQLYSGHTVALYCTDFEDGDPLAAGWTTGSNGGSRASTWAWTVPTSGVTNPHVAYSGTHVLAQAPNGNYAPNSDTWVMSPPIEIGHYSDVRLQYRRWLDVEDAHFDQATITANGAKVFENATNKSMGADSKMHHLDKEWRFHDVPLSQAFRGHAVVLQWELKSDPGLEFAGWTLDDVCVVANPNAICGDRVKTEWEECDNGSANADAPDACRTDCRLPMCGDGIVDSGEQCDDGANGSKTCTPQCTVIKTKKSGGCDAGGGSGGAGAGFVVAIFAVVRRRRRYSVLPNSRAATTRASTPVASTIAISTTVGTVQSPHCIAPKPCGTSDIAPITARRIGSTA